MGILDAIYNLIATILNFLGFSSPPRSDWIWTVRDQLGNSKSEINELFERYMKDQVIKAGQFALRINGNLAMSTAYTWAEPEYFITEPQHVMRIASCSKAFTTAGIQSLLAAGAVGKDEKVFARLGILENDGRVSHNPTPSDPRVWDITVEHLVKHTGGWDYSSPERAAFDWVFHIKEVGRRMNLDKPPTKDEFARFMFNMDLNFDPGDDVQSKYSNIGYLLLGMVIEKASKQTYIEYLNDKILSPIGITDVFVGKTRLADRREDECFYEDPFRGPDATLSPTSMTTAPLPYGGFGGMTELMDAGGGLITSANSLSRFIFSNNVVLKNLNESPGRKNARRDGGMPGTTAVSESFLSTNKVWQFDMAVIFNQKDKGSKLGGGSATLDPFINKLKQKIGGNFA